jgi:hypothetical protein
MRYEKKQKEKKILLFTFYFLLFTLGACTPPASPPFTPSPEPTFTPTLLLLSPTSAPTTPPTPAVTPFLAQYRLVAFYGVPAEPALGVLGSLPPEALWLELQKTAATFQALTTDGREVLPAVHLVTTIAQSEPGPTGRYSQTLPADVLTEWITFAETHNLLVIFDIQPGHGDVLQEVERLLPYLAHPQVHLALDPEFILSPPHLPGRHLGHIRPEQLNTVQKLLNEVAQETGQTKLLIVHQFDPRMVVNPHLIENYPSVELVLDVDGVGSPAEKTADYHTLAAQPFVEYRAIKLFFERDTPLLTPAEVMSLDPPPDLIIFQ